MEKLDHWKQSNPKDQLVVLLMSIKGDLSNIEDKINSDMQSSFNRIWIKLTEIEVLGKDWLKENW